LSGLRIKQYRADHNYSQKDLAARLGVSIRSVARWEQNKSKPYPNEVSKISSILGISEEELLREDDTIEVITDDNSTVVLGRISDSVDNLVTGQELMNEAILTNHNDYIKKQDEVISELRCSNADLIAKLEGQASEIESYKKELELRKEDLHHKKIRTMSIIVTCLILVVLAFGTWLYIMNNGFRGEIHEGGGSIETVYYYHTDNEQINQGG